MKTTNMPAFTAEASFGAMNRPNRAACSPIDKGCQQSVIPQLRAGPAAMGSVGQIGYVCGNNACICHGDEDCNNMFTYDCGGGFARCHIINGETYCVCSRL
jgi:hypothetical protein